MPTTPPVGPKRALLASAAGVVVIALALYFFWPVGVVLGLGLGVLIVLGLGGQQDRAARSVPQLDAFAVFAPLGLAPAVAAPQALPASRAPLAIAPAALVAPPAAPARPAAPVPAAAGSTEPVVAPAAPARPAAAESAPVRPIAVEPVRTDPVFAPRPVADPARPVRRDTVPTVPAGPAAAPARSSRTPVPSVRPAVREAAAPVRTERGVRADLDRLREELGGDYPDFARAARLVVSTQYASAARLQRDLQLPYSRARRLLADLESQHFVGPATGTLPRQVLLPKERLPEVERLFAGV